MFETPENLKKGKRPAAKRPVPRKKAHSMCAFAIIADDRAEKLPAGFRHEYNRLARVISDRGQRMVLERSTISSSLVYEGEPVDVEHKYDGFEYRWFWSGLKVKSYIVFPTGERVINCGQEHGHELAWVIEGMNPSAALDYMYNSLAEEKD